MDKEQQETNTSQEEARRLDEAKASTKQQQALDETNVKLKRLEEDIEQIKREEFNNNGTIIPRQVIHHPVPTPSSPAQITRRVFRGGGRRSVGGRTGGAIKGGAKKITKTAAKQGTKKAATVILSNPYVLAVIGIIFAILLLIILIVANICELTSAVDFVRPDWLKTACALDDISEDFPPPPAGVTIIKTGPDSIPNNESIDYKITVDYDSSLATVPPENMILVDLPDYEFDPASTVSTPPATVDGNLFKWNLTDLSSVTVAVGTVTTYTATITLKPTTLDSYVVNRVTVIDSTAAVQPPAQYPLPTCESGNYIACLKNQFNVTLKGTGSASRAKFFYSILSIPFKYPYYLELFKRVGVTITISPLETYNNIGHLTTDSTTGDITIYQAYFDDRQSTREQYLIHETAHAIARTAAGSRLQDRLWNLVNTRGFDITCFKPGPLVKTYPINNPRSFKNEVFAEAVADSVVCQDAGDCGPWGGGTITNFPKTCDGMYNFVDNNLLK